MLKGILGFFAFLFFLAVLILMLTGSYILKKVRQFNKAVQDAQDKQAFNHRRSAKTRRFSTTLMANMLTSKRPNYPLCIMNYAL